MAEATVFNPITKERKKVTVGDPDAFAGGFVLETPTSNLSNYQSPAPTGDTTASLLGGQTQGDIATQFNTFRGLLDSMTRQSYDKKPTVQNLVEVFRQKIGATGVTDPSVVGTMVDMQKGQQLNNVSDIYRQTLRTLNTMETTRINQINKGQETLMNLGQMGLLGQVTGQEYES